MANSHEVAQALHPELRDVIRQFEELRRTASRITDGLTAEQLEWKPAPDQWSIAECFSHLNVTADKYYPAIDRSMHDARERGLLGEGPFRHGFLINKFIRMMEPPARRPMKAPEIFRPRTRGLAAEVPNFFVHQDAILKRVREANGLDLARAKVTSPVTRLLRMTLGQCFHLLAAHERRHLWQAGNVRRALPDREQGAGSRERDG
jgi:hypothetical protein